MGDRVYVCDIEEITIPGSRGFSVELNGETLEGFVVRNDSGCFAYRNSCPHTGAPLDWVEHQFLDLDKFYIQCAVHDARFEMESGLCVDGPCTGDSLQALHVQQDSEALYLVLD